MNLKTELLPHQTAAVEKLRKLKIGALYMEQGTGKTRTTLSLIKEREKAGKVDVVLWLCPCSVKKNLREDILYHCGEIPRNFVIRGIESLSSSGRLYLQLLELVETHKVYLIVDESNLVKNHEAIRTARITRIGRFCNYKLILNGTPISKNEADMFAQWVILDWRILGYKSFYSFAANHLEYKEIKDPRTGIKHKTDQVARVLNVDYLTEKIAPYTYQIRKEDCLHLPKKEYRSMYFTMTPEQADLYDAIKWEYLESVNELRADTIYKLFTALQHVVSGRGVLSGPQERMQTAPFFSDWHDNPRIQKLKELIKDIGTEKCIIFAKYQSEIDTIEALLSEMNLTHVIFTGKLSQPKRQENRAAFQNDVQFFIANKVCGAYGLNLQFCRNIIYYSNDFDLATRMQSEDRVHRIGQTQEVRIYDICCGGTIDELIEGCLSRKESLVDTFKQEIDRWKGELTMQYKNFSAETDPDFYLRFGALFASRAIRKELDGYPLSNELDWTWVTALEGNTIAGFLAVEPKAQGLHIHAVYVMEGYRKQGVFRELVHRAVKFAGNRSITVTTRDCLAPVYTSNGFKETGKKGKAWVNMRRER